MPGGVIHIGSRSEVTASPIFWRSKQQVITALSSTEAEFVSATELARELIYVQRLLSEVLEYTKDAKVIDGIPDESYSLSSMMAQCRDFQNEPTAMEELTELLGHKQEKTPKKHPEVAGRGIEYCWGKAKMTFRHNNNYSSNAKNLEGRVRDALDPSAILTLERARKFNRKASDYKRSYIALDGGGGDGDACGEVEYADIEKLKKKCKTHRCTLDQDYAFIAIT